MDEANPNAEVYWIMPSHIDPLEELDKMAADAKRIAADHVSFEFVAMGSVAYEWAYRLERMAALLREATRDTGWPGVSGEDADDLDAEAA